jgi:hypothetical protein
MRCPCAKPYGLDAPQCLEHLHAGHRTSMGYRGSGRLWPPEMAAGKAAKSANSAAEVTKRLNTALSFLQLVPIDYLGKGARGDG